MPRLLAAANIIALALVGGYFSRPFIAEQIWREDYKTSMFRCDYAMKEHYLAKKFVEMEPTAISIKNLEATELALIDCHEYDMMRKRMLKWGISENGLSMIGLEAMEEKAYELRDFVEIHEIRY